MDKQTARQNLLRIAAGLLKSAARLEATETEKNLPPDVAEELAGVGKRVEAAQKKAQEAQKEAA